MIGIEQTVKLQNSLHGLLNWFLRPESDYLDTKGRHIAGMVASQITSGYGVFDSSLFKSRKRSVETAAFEREKYLKRDAEYLRPLVELCDFVNLRLKDFVSHFFLHGSMATMDYSKGWSDLDTFVVVNNSTLQDPGALTELRRLSFQAHEFLYRIDPLQHHGLIFAAETDLRAYPSCYMPPEVFEYAVSLLEGKSKIEFHLRDAQAQINQYFRQSMNLFFDAKDTGIFKRYAYKGEYLQDRYRNASNAMYQMKCFLGYTVNLPSYFLQARGEPSYKRESFERCRPLFSKESWDIIDKASRARQLWPEKENFPFKGNAIPRWLQETVGPDYFQEASDLVGEMAQLLDLAVTEKKA